MKRNKNIQEELSEIAPGLAKMKKENPFDIPHNYFQEMHREVMEKIEETPEAKTVSLWDKLSQQVVWLISPKPVIGTALAIACLLIYFNTRTDMTTEPTFLFEGLSTDVIAAYVEDNIELFESSELLEFTSFESIDLLDNTTSSDNYIDELIDDLEEEDFMDIY